MALVEAISPTCVVWLLIYAAGCGTAISRAGPAAAASDTSPIAATCLGCHDHPASPRPDLSAPLSHATATRALRAVLAWDMPPPSSASRAAFDDHRRARVVDWLCRETGRGASECARIAREDSGDALLRGGQTILEVLRRAGAPPVSERRAGLLLGTSPPGTVRTPRTAAMIANVVLVAIDACSPTSLFDRILGALPRWSRPPARTAEPRGACLQRTLELGLRAPAPPAAAKPAPTSRERGR